MQVASNNHSHRGVQRSPRPGTATYMQGKKQTALAIQKYHILCAALQNKYVIRDITPIDPIEPTSDKSRTSSELELDEDEGSNEHSNPGFDELEPLRFVRCTIDCSAYKEFKLHPIKDVELPEPGPDGSANLRALMKFGMVNRSDWKVREGGILYVVEAMCGEFFSCISNYHMHGRAGSDEWNTLFSTLQNSGYHKNIIPCMFFAKRDGCLDRDCPFLHDHEAVLAERNRIVEGRQETFRYKHRPTYRQSIFRELLVLRRLAGNNEALYNKIEKSGKVRENLKQDKAYCSNLECMKPWKKGMKNNPLKSCTRCKWALYCSPECQKADWPRHKKDPCAPIDEMVEIDDIWNPFGFRKGTTFVKSYRDLGTGGWHADA